MDGIPIVLERVLTIVQEEVILLIQGQHYMPNGQLILLHVKKHMINALVVMKHVLLHGVQHQNARRALELHLQIIHTHLVAQVQQLLVHVHQIRLHVIQVIMERHMQVVQDQNTHVENRQQIAIHMQLVVVVKVLVAIGEHSHLMDHTVMLVQVETNIDVQMAH